MKKYQLIMLTAIVLVLAFSGCSDMAELSDKPADADLTFFMRITDSGDYTTSGGIDYHREEGVLASDAEYVIAVPSSPNWDGDLVLYTHGYTAPGVPFSESDEYPLAEYVLENFLDQGFAVTFSSYRETGWAVKDGSIRTHQLRGYFAEKFGETQKVYLAGVSEGALIAVKLAEQHPGEYDGVLAIAGPLGGAAAEFAYIVNTRLVFDHFYKTAVLTAANPAANSPFLMEAASLAGALGYADGAGVFEVSPPSAQLSMTEFTGSMVPFLMGLMLSDPYGAIEMSRVTVDGWPLFPYGSLVTQPADFLWTAEFATTVAASLWYNIYGTEDLLAKTHGMIPLDNAETAYASDGLEFDVERFTSEPAAVNYLNNWYDPSGKIAVPVVILHTQRDPAVPYFHALAYKALDTTGLVVINPPGIYQPFYSTAFGHGIVVDFSGGTPSPLVDESVSYFLEGFSTLYYMVSMMP